MGAGEGQAVIAACTSEQFPRLPGVASAGGGSAMAAPPTPTHEEATEPLLQANNTQQH